MTVTGEMSKDTKQGT